MVCASCQSAERRVIPVEEESHHSAAASGLTTTCERCGRALDGETLDQLAAKVSQLARFGLTGRPLLSRRRG